MFAHRRVKRRFQLDIPHTPQRDTAHSPSHGLLPTLVAVRPRRRKRRFHIGPPEVSPWRALRPQQRLAQVIAHARVVFRPVQLTLAQRRQMRRLGIIAGGLLTLIALIASSLWFIPSTHAALFPSQAQTNAPGSTASGSGPGGASIHALHYDAGQPFATLQTHTTANGTPAPSIQATAAFLFDPARGWLLYQKNADTSYPAAGLAKVMTLLLALDAAPLDEVVTIGPGAAALVNSNNSYMGVSVGEQLTMRELLYGLMVAGGNDAAIAIADAVAGNQASFVTLMNARARQLGLTQTHFVTADGVDDGDVTSASDMAKLSALVMLRPEAAQFTSVDSVVIPPTATHKGFRLQGGNDLLPGGVAPYAGANGVKTGYTASAQYCIAFSARVNGRLLVGAALGEPNAQARDADAHALLDWGFAQT